jgi:hypothetical protein
MIFGYIGGSDFIERLLLIYTVFEELYLVGYNAV